MGTSEFSEMTDDAHLSSAEAREVLERVASRESGGDGPDLRPMARVEDVAEALRLDVAEVKAMLEDVRATPRKESNNRQSKMHAAAYAGWLVAVAAVAWAAFPRKTLAVPQAPPVGAPALAVPDTIPLRPLQEVAVVPLKALPPVGYSIGVKANGVVLTLAGRQDVHPAQPAEVRKHLEEAVALLVQRANEIGASHAFEPGQAMMVDGYSATTLVWINGPGYGSMFELPAVSYTGPATISTLKAWRSSIEGSIKAMLSRQKARIGPESGLRGVVMPPSGFELRFVGRRVAGMSSSPFAVEPLNEKAVAERLTGAMRSMMEADLKPIEGRWRQDAAIEAKLKTPERSRFTIETIDGKVEFEVPTKPGTSRSEQDRILRERAQAAVHGYIQRKAVGS
jgi:hypothetical protein